MAYLGHCHSVGTEVVLVAQHGRVDILRTVGLRNNVSIQVRWCGVTQAYHEVEACHEQHHVDEEQPVPLQRNFAFGDEGLSDIVSSFSDSLTLLVCLCLGQAETEDDYQDWGTCAEPEQLYKMRSAAIHF